MSARVQSFLVWWSVILLIGWGLMFVFLLHLLPPPLATWDTNQIAQFYSKHATSIRWGAVVGAETSGFFVPFWVVVSLQIARLDRGKVWAIAAFAGGTLMSIWLALPPIFFGVAAWDPTRAPALTALMHQLAMLTLITTTQYFFFAWLAVIVVSLKSTTVKHSPFPRWYGYFTVWSMLALDMGCPAFLTRTGPFAWHGLLAYWTPLATFSVWTPLTCYLLLRALKKQRLEEEQLIGNTGPAGGNFIASAA